MSEMPSAEEIKANCPFCKIIAGEIPSKKVYEDEKMIAILDINPANKGHVLVMPKDHYPILPTVPPEIFKHLFNKTKKLMTSMRKALIVPKVTVFVANGGVAGQQSPHFLYHLIPRESGDGLDMLDINKYDVDQSNNQQALAQNMQIIMKNFLQREIQTRNPAAIMAIGEQQKPMLQTQPTQETNMPASSSTNPNEIKTQLAAMLEANPQLKQLIITNPKQVHDYAQSSPELKVLFEGIDIFALSEKLRQQAGITKVIPLEEQEKKSVEVTSNPESVKNNIPDDNLDTSATEEQPKEASKINEKNNPQNIPKISEENQDEKTHIQEHNSNNKKEETNTQSDVPDAANLSDEELINFLNQKPKLKELLFNDIKTLKKMQETNPRVKTFFQTQTPEEVVLRLEQKEILSDDDFKALENYFK